MTYNPDIHHRKSIRLKNYDYSQEELYFITICTENREKLFGKIENDNVGAHCMCPNSKMIKNKIIGNDKILKNIKNIIV